MLILFVPFVAVFLKICEAAVGGVPVLGEADVLIDVAPVLFVVELFDPVCVHLASFYFEN